MKEADFDGIMQGLDQARAYARGRRVPGLAVHVPRDIDVAGIRRRTGLSQPAFAEAIGVRVATLRNWEQGRRTPEGPARVLLSMLSRDPGIVTKMLGTASAAARTAGPSP